MHMVFRTITNGLYLAPPFGQHGKEKRSGGQLMNQHVTHVTTTLLEL